MNFEIVDITELGTAILTVSAIVMVLVDMLKASIKPMANNKDAKYLASVIIAVAITLSTGISIFEATNGTAFYLGAVLAGFIASLGSNFIHEFMKILQTLKTLKSSGQKFKR